MKRFLSTALTVLVLMTAVFGFTATAADSKTDVYVTIANGTLALVREKVSVTDADGDGKLTVNDALILAHDAKYEGGSAAGYSSENSDWGLSLKKLWGVENGGSYGYYVNNAMSNSLADEVKNGDYIVAFVYTDTKGFSDAYSWFDKTEATVSGNGEVTLTLTSSGYDANWNVVKSPVAGAKITLDGKDTGLTTDNEGKVTVKAGKAGRYIVSASSESAILVPPVAVLTVTAPSPATGDSIVTVMIIIGAVALAGALVVIVGRKRRA